MKPVEEPTYSGPWYAELNIKILNIMDFFPHLKDIDGVWRVVILQSKEVSEDLGNSRATKEYLAGKKKQTNPKEENNNLPQFISLFNYILILRVSDVCWDFLCKFFPCYVSGYELSKLHSAEISKD